MAKRRTRLRRRRAPVKRQIRRISKAIALAEGGWARARIGNDPPAVNSNPWQTVKVNFNYATTTGNPAVAAPTYSDFALMLGTHIGVELNNPATEIRVHKVSIWKQSNDGARSNIIMNVTFGDQSNTTRPFLTLEDTSGYLSATAKVAAYCPQPVTFLGDATSVVFRALCTVPGPLNIQATVSWRRSATTVAIDRDFVKRHVKAQPSESGMTPDMSALSTNELPVEY